MQEMQVQSLGPEDPVEEGTVSHSSILAWRIPWTEEPSQLQFIGSQRVRHNCSNLACMHAVCVPGFPGGSVVKNLPANAEDTGDLGSIPESRNSLEEEMATHPVFLPGKSHGQRSLAGYSARGRKRVGLNWSDLAGIPYSPHFFCLG